MPQEPGKSKHPLYDPDEPLRLADDSDAFRLKQDTSDARLADRPTDSQADTVRAGPEERVEPASKNLGPYELRCELGRGAVGVVWKAFHAGLRQHYALKLLRASGTNEDVERFLREARAMARLGKHPNIVQVHSVGTEAGIHYFAMDFIEGETLESRIAREGPLPEREALEIARKVLLALDYAHKEQLIHRDVKPSNVLLDLRGEPHVADFGLVQDMSPHALETWDGKAVGTPAYMAPEQARGGRADARSDLFSVGALLYQALTGRRPFEGRTSHEVMRAVLHELPVPPRKVLAELSPLADRIAMRALEKDPRARYPSARAFADDISRALEKEGGPARPPAERAPGRRRVEDANVPIRALRTNEYALAAWKWGVFGFGVASLVGILYAIAALVQLRFGAERERETGRGLALAGGGIGALSTAGVVALAFFLLHLSTASQRETEARRSRDRALATLRGVSDALARYRDRTGAYPRAASGSDLRRLLLENGSLRYEISLPVDRSGQFVDPWSNALRYVAPGAVNKDSFDLWSTGPNGRDEEGQGDDLSNFDPRRRDLWPVEEHEDERAAMRALEGIGTAGSPDAERRLRQVALDFPGTRAAREAQGRIDEMEGRAKPAGAPADLGRDLSLAESNGQWGKALALSEGYLKTAGARDRAELLERRKVYTRMLDEIWLGARIEAAQAIALARDRARTPGVAEKDVDVALRAVTAPLERAASAQAPALDARLAEARAGLSKELSEVQKLRGSLALRAAVRDRVRPLLIRRDLDAARKELDRIGAELEDADAGELARERSEIGGLESCFARATAAIAVRQGSEETLRLRSGELVTGRVDGTSGQGASEVILLRGEGSAAPREIAVLDLDGDTVIRLADTAPTPAGAEKGSIEAEYGLLLLGDGDLAKARGWFEKARAKGTDVSRYLGEVE